MKTSEASGETETSDWFWRAAEIAQGVAVVAVTGLGIHFAVSIDRSELDVAVPSEAQRTPPARPERIPPLEVVPGVTIFIVSSEEEAQLLRTALAAANQVRLELGRPGMEDEVVVAESLEQATVIADQVREGNAILDGLGFEHRTVNLVR